MNFTLSGNLAKDPVFDSFGTDGVRARIRVGSDRWTSDDDGNRTTVAEFHDITMFGRVAEKLRDATTGDSVRLTGDVRPARWTKDGNTVYGHNFVARSVDWQTKEDARAAREQAKQATGEQNATEITVLRMATPSTTVGSGEYGSPGGSLAGSCCPVISIGSGGRCAAGAGDVVGVAGLATDSRDH